MFASLGNVHGHLLFNIIPQARRHNLYIRTVKFMFSKKATKIFTVNLTLTTYCQIDGEDFVNFCDLLRKHELYCPNI